MMNRYDHMPLLVTLLVTGIGFTAAAVIGRRNGYYERYDTDLLEKPYLAQVFEGIHDKVYPWGEETSRGREEALALLNESSTEGTTQESTEESAADTAASSAAALADTENEESTASSEEAQESGAEESTEEEEPAVSLSLPASSTNAVVQAVDYGNTDYNYAAAPGTVWERDTDPQSIFATNGTYYPLQTVDDSYFKDAIFIGDSRTEGLYVYSSMRNGITTFDAKDSVTIYSIYDTSLDYFGVDGTQGSMTAMEALQAKQYRKVYFSVGVNELGMPTSDYFARYKEFIQVIRRLQPDAIIYVEGIMHVTGSYARNNSVYNNTNIVGRNEALSTLANGRDIFYIDMNSAVCDADGNLPEDLSYDGVHLKASAYETWHQFLLENAAVRSSADWESTTAADAAAASDDAGAESTAAESENSAGDAGTGTSGEAAQ